MRFAHAEDEPEDHARTTAYSGSVPRLWNDTIEAHRHEVRDAILEATVTLVVEHGLRAVTMLEIAKKTGIGRATLYKYFPDVESILLAWHQGHVSAHLEYLAGLQQEARKPEERLRALLEGFATIQQQHAAIETEIVSILHRGEHMAHAQRHLGEMVRDRLAECAKAGVVRRDIPANELASYCIHALSAAATLRSKKAVSRLVEATLTGLRPPR